MNKKTESAAVKKIVTYRVLNKPASSSANCLKRASELSMEKLIFVTFKYKCFYCCWEQKQVWT